MRKLSMIFTISAVCLVALSGCSNKQEKIKQTETNKLESSQTDNEIEKSDIQNTIEADFSNDFNGINGCAILYSPLKNRYSLYNKDMAEQEASPYSTFKIVSTLSGLNNGVIVDETSTMNYNGTEYPNSDWNSNLTLEKAFHTSCIWYFHQIIDTIGEDKIKKELRELEYGNCDTSEWDGSNINPYAELNGFWLNSSLKISPLEQVEVLVKIFEGKSIYDSKSIKILKDIMLIQDDGTQQIYGKTGSGSNGEAWFVGFTEKGEQREYFAIYLNDSSQKEQISSSVAKEIALKIVKD